MARLADQIATWPMLIPRHVPPSEHSQFQEGQERIRKDVAAAVVIAADSVAEYFYAGTGQEVWGPDDLPCCAPPFPLFFVEARRPSRIFTESSGASPADCLPTRWGWLFKAFDSGQPSGFGLAAVLAVVSPCGGGVVAPLCGMSCDLGGGGEIVRGPLLWGPHPDGLEPMFARHVHSHCHGMLYSALLTLSFMNCRNVAVRDNVPPAPTARKARHLKGRAEVTYKTLEIRPMREVLRREGRSETEGLRRALHICRGHFADYTGRGLFGKHFGRFWIPPHVRGSDVDGRVEKDYSIGPPARPDSPV